MKYFNHLLNDQNSPITIKDCTKLDNYLYRQIKRKKYNSLILVGYRTKEIVLKHNKIRVTRRYYFDKVNKQYLFLFDEFIKLKKREKLPEFEKNDVKSYIFRGTKYREITRIFNNNVSITLQSRLIKHGKVKVFNPTIKDPLAKKHLYINIDDGYKNFKVDKTCKEYQVRIINISQKNTKKAGKNGPKYTNECNIAIVKKANDKQNITNLTTEILCNIIHQYYGQVDRFKIFFTCDGDPQLQKSGKALTKYVVYDKLHFLTIITRIYNHKNLSRNNNLTKKTKRNIKKTKKRSIVQKSLLL